jgi:hypothetical protein
VSTSLARARAAAVAALALGCSGLPPPMVGDPGPELSDAKANAEYTALVDHFSAQRQIFRGFETICFAGVTYESATFVAARIRRRDAFLAQPPAQLAKDLQEAEADGAQFYDFTLGAYIQNPRFDDLDLSSSIWRVMLVTPAGEVVPVSVKRVGRADVNTRAYYPYMGDFWTVYRVRFAKSVADRPVVPPELKTFTLVLASSLGRAEFPLPTE